MNILVINQPLNNRGDESAHRALLRRIVSDMPEAKVTVLFVDQKQDSIDQFNIMSPNVEYKNVKSQRGFNKVSMLALKKKWTCLLHFHPTTRYLLSLYKSMDVVVCAPGGICMGGFQNWAHLRQLMFAKYLSLPVAYYGRSFGPFPEKTASNRLFKRISLEMLRYFSFCSIRDKKTETLAQSLDIKYVPTVDSAFLDSTKVSLPREVMDLIGTEKYVVFVPNLLIWHYAYKGRISRETVIRFFSGVFSCITDRFGSAKVVMLPQTFNYGSYDGDDILFFRDLAKEINDSRIIVVSDRFGSDVQQALIANALCMVGARYHSIVFAINQAVPFVALSYEHKIAGLLDSLGKQNCCVDIANALNDDTSINRAISDFRKKLAMVSVDISLRDHAKELANDCFRNFLSWLKLRGNKNA